MTEVLIKIFAKQIKLPEDQLLKQLEAAGVTGKSDVNDTLNETEMRKLLAHLRKAKAETSKDAPLVSRSKITLNTRSTNSLKQKTRSNAAKTVQVEVKRKRTFVKQEEPEPVEEAPVVEEQPAKQPEPEVEAEPTAITAADEAQVEEANAEAEVEAPAKEEVMSEDDTADKTGESEEQPEKPAEPEVDPFSTESLTIDKPAAQPVAAVSDRDRELAQRAKRRKEQEVSAADRRKKKKALRKELVAGSKADKKKRNKKRE